MEPRCSLAELIELVGCTYKAMDFRTVALREVDKDKKESWKNFMTVVRLTWEEPEHVERRLREKQQEFEPDKTAELQIILGCRPFSEWGALCGEISSAAVVHSGRTFWLQQSINLPAIEETVRQFDHDIRTPHETPWSALCIKHGVHDAGMLTHQKFARAVSGLGYSNPYEAINALCEINVEFGSRAGFDFCLYAPIFARVSNCGMVPSTCAFLPEMEKHQALNEIQAIAVLRDPYANTASPPKVRTAISDWTPAKTDGCLEISTGKVQVPENLASTDVLEIRLNLHPLGQIHQWSYVVRQLTPAKERNILLEALKSFCPESEIKRLLLQAEEVEAKKLKPSAAFEKHVGWLLSLFGLSAIVLGEYEHLKAPGTSVRVGSVDILAAHQKSKLLLLVGCSFAAPSEHDFSNLVAVRERLQRGAFADTTVRILPVFFTAALSCDPYREDTSVGYIPVIDVDRTARFLELLEQGQELRFFDFVANPQYGE
ncbi:MAG: hypothetical protein ACRD5K_00405 [Candidatus Acidiferrales bacterium]